MNGQAVTNSVFNQENHNMENVLIQRILNRQDGLPVVLLTRTKLSSIKRACMIKTECDLKDDIKPPSVHHITQFAASFKTRRKVIGATQDHIANVHSHLNTVVISPWTLSKFENLELPIEQAKKMYPILKKWIQEAELGDNKSCKGEKSKIKKKKTPRCFNVRQLRKLHDIYTINKNPSKIIVEELANDIDCSEKSILNWFEERRKKVNQEKEEKESCTPLQKDHSMHEEGVFVQKKKRMSKIEVLSEQLLRNSKNHDKLFEEAISPNNLQKQKIRKEIIEHTMNLKKLSYHERVHYFKQKEKT